MNIQARNASIMSMRQRGCSFAVIAENLGGVISRQRVAQIVARQEDKARKPFPDLSTKAATVMARKGIKSWAEFHEFVTSGKRIATTQGCGKRILAEIERGYARWSKAK